MAHSQNFEQMPHLVGGGQPVALAHNFADGVGACLGKLRGALIKPQAPQEFSLLCDWVSFKTLRGGQLRKHGEIHMCRQIGFSRAGQRIYEFMVFHGLKTVPRRRAGIAIVNNQRRTADTHQVGA